MTPRPYHANKWRTRRYIAKQDHMIFCLHDEADLTPVLIRDPLNNGPDKVRVKCSNCKAYLGRSAFLFDLVNEASQPKEESQ